MNAAIARLITAMRAVILITRAGYDTARSKYRCFIAGTAVAVTRTPAPRTTATKLEPLSTGAGTTQGSSATPSSTTTSVPLAGVRVIMANRPPETFVKRNRPAPSGSDFHDSDTNTPYVARAITRYVAVAFQSASRWLQRKDRVRQATAHLAPSDTTGEAGAAAAPASPSPALTMTGLGAAVVECGLSVRQAHELRTGCSAGDPCARCRRDLETPRIGGAAQ